jgi:hypothetical protein
MDPNATIRALFEAIADQDGESYNEAFRNLRGWLKKGGFPPVVTSLGREAIISGEPSQRDRLTLSTHGDQRPRMAILSRNIDNIGDGFDFIVYDHEDNRSEVYPLATK